MENLEKDKDFGHTAKITVKNKNGDITDISELARAVPPDHVGGFLCIELSRLLVEPEDIGEVDIQIKTLELT